MPTETERSDPWRDAAAELLALTQNGDLDWTNSRSGTDTDSVKYSQSFYTIIESEKDGEPGNRVRVSEVQVRIPQYILGQDRSFWRTNHIIEVGDERGLTYWQLPIDDVASDLYEAVKYQKAGVNRFVRRMKTHRK